ncbi:Gag-Pol polyprotein [Plakobranchus ocellatus]|uniref:Gag-Pol polyprotein n=1 Tax=Plakobranchus ocellatus TaxID=259542 RepID=A0AAV4DGW0_9GAST|nr:Gag-Pol polyprotein [Plakobranchus ocellatus]
MATMEEIVKKADLLGYRGEKREEYLKQEFNLLAERQAREKKEEAERQAREKKEEAEGQERKEEAERQAREKREEAERQERTEEADRMERLELEKMKLDAEMKLLQAKIEVGIIKNEPDGSGARSSDAGAKHPKLPNFQDGRDDLDIWLTRFERFAESNAWSREKWSSSLCALLTGRALDCYGRLSAEQAKDYDKVKEALMKRYDLTEDGYRRKFRTCKPAEAVDSTTKKAGAGVVVKTTEVNTAEVKKLAEGPTMEVTDDLQSEVEGGMLKLASGKSVHVMTNCADLRDPEKTRSLGLSVLKGEIGGREVDVMRHTGCESVVVRKQLVDASQLTGECCLLLRIDNTALLAGKAVISLRTPFLSGEVKALCIPDAICDVIVGNVEGARSSEDPDMSVMVGATRAQAKREAVTKPLRVLDIERHVGVDREQLIKFQQEDPRILALVDAGRTSQRGVGVVSFEKARGIVYRRYEDLGRYVDVKQEVGGATQAAAGICYVGSPRFYYWSASWDQENERQGPEQLLLAWGRWRQDKIDTESVAEALVDIYSRLGVPEEVLSDQGTQFISDCMKEVCRLLGIKQKTTTPYHPMRNGLVERFNATLKTCLRRLCSEQLRQWHRYTTLFCLPTERCHRSPRTLQHSSCCMEGP